MKRAMISQPMKDKSEAEIYLAKKSAETFLKNSGYDVKDTFFKEDWNTSDNLKNKGITNISMYFLAKSIEYMSECDTVYFCKGWENARGCKIEHEVAKSYGLNIIYEK